MKTYTEDQIDTIIKLRYGKLVDNPNHVAFVSLKKLGKIFGCSYNHIRSLYMRRFEKIRLSKLPLLERLRQASKEDIRFYYGLRFLKQHELDWIVSRETLKNQIALSLKDRCAHFS